MYPSSVIVFPFTEMTPILINSSASRLEHTPLFEMYLFSLIFSGAEGAPVSCGSFSRVDRVFAGGRRAVVLDFCLSNGLYFVFLGIPAASSVFSFRNGRLVSSDLFAEDVLLGEDVLLAPKEAGFSPSDFWRGPLPKESSFFSKRLERVSRLSRRSPVLLAGFPFPRRDLPDSDRPPEGRSGLLRLVI